MAKDLFGIVGKAYEVSAVFVRAGITEWSVKGGRWGRVYPYAGPETGPGYNVEEFRLWRGTRTGLFTARNRYCANGHPQRYGQRLFVWPNGTTGNTKNIDFGRNNILIPPKHHELRSWLWVGEYLPVVYIQRDIRDEFAELCTHHFWSGYSKAYPPKGNHFLCNSQEDAEELISVFKLKY
jgi:hypothetical protein